MRLRTGRGLLCLILAGGALTLTVLFLLKQAPTLPLPLTTTSSSSSSSQPPGPPSLRRLRLKGLSQPLQDRLRPANDPANPPYPVPTRPPRGDVPLYPMPDELREKAPLGGEAGEGGEVGGLGGGLGPQPPEQGVMAGGEAQGMDLVAYNASSLLVMKPAASVVHREEDTPLKVAEGLWDLIAAPKEVVTDDNQQGSPFDCAPRHHIFFGKIHKTGSSTVANILQRFGFLRDLNFVLPRKSLSAAAYNYLSKPGQSPSRAMLMPPPLGQHYDVLWCHAVYDRAFYHVVMPADTVYVTILRHPFEQFLSAFEYYGRMPGSYLNHIYQMNVGNPLSVYLKDPDRYEDPKKMTSYIRNKQSQDLGMTAHHMLNATVRHHYIQQLGQDFHLVMITEFFDESLVLLRRLMCWGLKDILYIPKNKNTFKKKRSFSEDDLTRHRQLNEADFDLYNFFHDRFQQTLKEQGSDFQQEVETFKRLLGKVQIYCTRWSGGYNMAFRVPATRWSGPFVVKRYDCSLMQKPELPFLNDLMMDAVRKYQHSAVLNSRL